MISRTRARTPSASGHLPWFWISRSVIVISTIRESAGGSPGRRRMYQSYAARSTTSNRPRARRPRIPNPTSSTTKPAAKSGERKRLAIGRPAIGARLEPAVDHEEGRPEARVLIARVLEHLELRSLQGNRPRDRRIL